jgi:pimeloyl-ACP methyl ester carboxylesterase
MNGIVLTTRTLSAGGQRYESDFGTLRIPENPDIPTSRILEIPIVRIHATGKTKEAPIFFLNGGPGITNIEKHFPGFLIRNHDFVMVGYRGVDGNSVLDFPHVRKAYSRIDSKMSSGFLKKIAHAYDIDSKNYRKKGYDLDRYNIMEVIEDMELARKALGYDKIHLFSLSYGTRVAYLYSLKYPRSIHRSVMIGANPPGRFVWEPSTIDRQLEYYNRLWKDDPEYVAKCPDIVKAMRHSFEKMPKNYFFIPLNAAKIKVVTFMLLYSKFSAALIFDSYAAADKGDYSGLALMSIAYNFLFLHMFTWGDLMLKGGTADGDTTRDYEKEMDPDGSIIGSPVAKLIIGYVKYSSMSLRMIPEEFRKAKKSDTETLIISGSIDFSTPAQYARDELLPHLPNGHQVILSEMGHVRDLYGLQTRALTHLIKSFYDRGNVDSSLYHYDPVDFWFSFSFRTLMKAIVGIVIGVSAIALFVAGKMLLGGFLR